MSLFTKREHSLFFSWLKKSSFLKLMLLLNFMIRWSWNILYLFNISMMLNKWIIRWFWVNVTTKAQPICLSKYTTTTSSNIKCRLWLTFFDVPFLIYFNIFGVMYQKKQDRFATCFKTCGKNSCFFFKRVENYSYEQMPQAWVWAHHISTLVRLLPDHRIIYVTYFCLRATVIILVWGSI